MHEGLFFTHPGIKIMRIARFLFFLETILSIVLGILFLCNNQPIYIGLLCIFVGPLFAFVSCIVLHGFGRIVLNSDTLNHIYSKLPLPDEEIDPYFDEEQ